MEVLVIQRVTNKDLARISAVDQRLNVIDGRGWFDDEIRDTWPQRTVQRYLKTIKSPASTPQERGQLVATAEIILGGFPFPLDLRARAPRLRWFHQLPAGASNLRRGDLWGSDVIVTTSRGYGDTQAMAEYVLAGFLHFARGLDMAYRDQRHHQFDHRTYRPILLQDKTVCIIRNWWYWSECSTIVCRNGHARCRNPALCIVKYRSAARIQPSRRSQRSSSTS